MTEEEDTGLAEELENQKPLCYYVMNNGSIDEDKATFERPNNGIQQYLKPFLIWAKVENMGINEVLVNRGESNLMPHSLLRKVGKYDTNLRSRNIVLSNNEGKLTNP